MPRPDDSLCLHCNKKLPLYQRLKQAQFCSKAHEDAHRQQQDSLGLERLFETHSNLQALRPIGSIESILGPEVNSQESQVEVGGQAEQTPVPAATFFKGDDDVVPPPPEAPAVAQAPVVPAGVRQSSGSGKPDSQAGGAVCLHCNGKLPLFRKLKNGQFCSKEHQEEYTKHQEQLGLERLFATHSNLQALRVNNGAESILGPEPVYAELPVPRLREEPSLEEVQERLNQLAAAAPPKLPTPEPVHVAAESVPDLSRLMPQAGPDVRDLQPAILAGDPLHFDIVLSPARPSQAVMTAPVGSLTAAGTVSIPGLIELGTQRSGPSSEVWESLAALNRNAVVQAFVDSQHTDEAAALPVFETARLWRSDVSAHVPIDAAWAPHPAGSVPIPVVDLGPGTAAAVSLGSHDLDSLPYREGVPSWPTSMPAIGSEAAFQARLPDDAPLVSLAAYRDLLAAAPAECAKVITPVETPDNSPELCWPHSVGPITDESVWSWVPEVAGVRSLPWFEFSASNRSANATIAHPVGAELQLLHHPERVAAPVGPAFVLQNRSARPIPVADSGLFSLPVSGTARETAPPLLHGTSDWCALDSSVELPPARSVATDGGVFDELYAAACPLSGKLLSLAFSGQPAEDASKITRATGLKPLFRTVGNDSLVDSMRVAASPVSSTTVAPMAGKQFALPPVAQVEAARVVKAELPEPCMAAAGRPVSPQMRTGDRRNAASACKLFTPSTVLFRLAALGFLQPLAANTKPAGNLILEQVPGEFILPRFTSSIAAPRPAVAQHASIRNLAFASLLSRGSFSAVSGFWHNAPRDLKVLLFAIPLLAALAFRPTLPKISLSVPEGTGGFGQVVNAQLASLRRTVLSRAAVALDEDFRQGLDEWLGKGGATTRWAFDSNGFVQPGPLALYRPSMELTDYKMEFFGILDQKALSWVIRAADFQNYYVVKLVMLKPGPVPTMGLMRYAVIDGVAQDRVDTPITIVVREDMPFRIIVNANGPDVSVYIQDQLMDSWSEPRLQRGGVGFFTANDEKSRVRWVQVTHQYDALGRLCAYLAPYEIPNSTEGR